jgi:hypothetical protein
MEKVLPKMKPLRRGSEHQHTVAYVKLQQCESDLQGNQHGQQSQRKRSMQTNSSNKLQPPTPFTCTPTQDQKIRRCLISSETMI